MNTWKRINHDKHCSYRATPPYLHLYLPCESTQLQTTNTPEDIEDILGTRAFQRYVDTPIQTLDGIVVNQPKHFLPLAKEAKKIAEEIRIEKINEQWAGIPREQLLN